MRTFIKSQGLRVALAGLVLAAGTYYESLETPPSDTLAQSVNTQEFLVLDRPVLAGQSLAPQDFRVESLNPDVLPSTAVLRRQAPQLAGLVARGELAPGQLLTLYDLKAPQSTDVDRARLLLERGQIQGLNSDDTAEVTLLSPSGRIDRAGLTPVGDQVWVSVNPAQAETLGRMARGPMQAIYCPPKGCVALKPIVTRKPRAPVEPRGLQVSYGVQP